MIEIPGYRIVRPLGRGGMATVYLALQESVQREVALKVMSGTLLSDPQFGERFLREARIAAKLRHPNVVQVHDVGMAEDHHYIAMEYLPGGPVLTRNGSPRPVDFALRVTREIAGALAYAGERGVVHRDIKPDNILLREDGAAVLTDFGIARASDNSRMTRTGAIIGTPHYMSPEQARGLPLDGRADLYSLGIVFHELLVGRVPYQAEDSLAVGIMHITAPLPRLPETLRDMQPLLDRMLAKEPNQRFQDGNVLAAEIALMEKTLGGATLPMHVPRARKPEPPTVATPAVTADFRTEPALGRIDELLRAPERSRRRVTRRRRGGSAWIVAALLLIGVGLGLWFKQDALRDLLPSTRMNDLLARADLALIENRLIDPEGQGARELYRAALALDPDSLPARQGLQRVGGRLLDASRAALAAGDLDAARTALAQARDLSVPAAEADALQRDLDSRSVQGMQIGALLDAAAQARQAGRLDAGEDSAVSLYRRVLTADPGNAIALAGLRDTQTAMLDRARALIEAGETDAASARIEAVAAIDPGHLGLPDARAALAAAASQRQADLDARFTEAERHLAAGRLTAPESGNAHRAYLEILRDDPRNARALEGLRRVAGGLVAQAQRQLADFEFERAEALLQAAQSIDAAAPGLAAARQKLSELQRRSEQAALPDPAAPAMQAQIASLLQDARRAAAAGSLLAPPGDSAYDKYRAVLRIAPDDAAARDGLAALPALARQRFENEIGANRLQAAQGAIDALATLSAADPALPDMRRRLARSLLGQAAERLGAGELARARQAFDTARELDPTNSELPAMQARLEQAGG